MSDVRARLRLPDHRAVDVHPGDIVGRMPAAAARVDDPRVSEAHALVSLRDGRLHLLALRGPLVVRGQRVSAVALEAGTEVRLAVDLAVHALSVTTPASVLALDLGDRVIPLVGRALTLRAGPAGTEIVSHPAQADVRRMHDGRGWAAHGPGLDGAALDVGRPFLGGGRAVTPASIPLAMAGATRTRTRSPRHTWLLAYDRLEVQTAAGPPVHVTTGKGARIVYDLHMLGAVDDHPTPWKAVARSVWQRELEDDGISDLQLSYRWTATLKRLRADLAAAGVRDDLVVAGRSGRVSLHLGADAVRLIDHQGSPATTRSRAAALVERMVHDGLLQLRPNAADALAARVAHVLASRLADPVPALDALLLAADEVAECFAGPDQIHALLTE